MAGATAAVTCEINFRLPLGSVYTGQATVNFPDSRSTTESKLINAWPSLLQDHARRLVHLSRVVTNAERSSIGAELEKNMTNGKDDTPLSVASPSSGTALRSSFIPSLSTISEQSAPGAAKAASDTPVQVLTAHMLPPVLLPALGLLEMTRRLHTRLCLTISFLLECVLLEPGREFCRIYSSYARVLCFHWSSP
jgi:hypothetical protein